MSVRETQDTADNQELTSYRLKDLIKDIKGDLPGLKTGYKQLDELIRIPRDAITIIAGRPGHGKTSFQLNLLVNFLTDPLNKGRQFYFFSYEEARKRIATKLIMIMAEKTLHRVHNHADYLNYLKRRSKTNNSKDPKIEEAIKVYDKLSATNSLFIFDNHFKFKKLTSILEKLGSNRKVGAVFIDYIQKIPYENISSGIARYEQLKEISDTFLNISKNYSFPIIMGAQFKRSTSAMKSSISSLRLDYLRESGDIEQDANLVLGILNPEADSEQTEDQKGKDPHKIHVFVLKNRSGVSGTNVSLKFDGPTLKFWENIF